MKEMTLYQKVIHCNKYARFLKEEGRREYWHESVDRLINYLIKRIKPRFHVAPDVFDHLFGVMRNELMNMNAMPSMRLFFSAGKAVEKENQMAYNCKFQSMHDLKSFADLLYSLMCTCGVGCSVEHEYINQLPKIPEYLHISSDMIVVKDSRQGWAEALLEFLEAIFYRGIIHYFDVSQVRKKGETLVSSGGTASGPVPLMELRAFISQIVSLKQGERLTSTDVFDIICKIAGCVVAGGLRRSAIITLFDEDDDEMFHVKDPEKLEGNEHRYNSNNTVVATKAETIRKVLKVAKLNGEPGIFFKRNVDKKMQLLGRTLKRGSWGVNPCSEIVLRPNSYCNLSEAILRQGMSDQELENRIGAATLFGLLQATLTDFHFVDQEAIDNQEEESLLGVSLTGTMDCPEFQMMDQELLKSCKRIVEKTVNAFWQLFGLKNKPTATTTIKPSGTVGLLANCSSGIHARYAPFYIKRMIIGPESELYDFLADQGLPFIEVSSVDGRIFEFPMKSPEGSLLVKDISLDQQLNVVKNAAKYWCDHNVSCTIYVKDDEWESLAEKLIDSEDFLSLSFLPLSITKESSGFAYLPLEEISEDEYNRRKEVENKIVWEEIEFYYKKIEVDDDEEQKRDFACVGGACDLQ